MRLVAILAITCLTAALASSLQVSYVDATVDVNVDVTDACLVCVEPYLTACVACA